MALGATAGSVVRMVMRRTALLALLGAAIGILGSLAATRVLTKSLFEVKPTDPATFAVVTGMIALVALLAGFLPSARDQRSGAYRAPTRLTTASATSRCAV